MKYDLVVYIGRFQPVHSAHVEIIRRAQREAPRVLVLVGSAFLPRTYKNPFTYEERAKMIKEATPEVVVAPLFDSMYNDQAWAAQVQAQVALHASSASKVALIGHKKDDSSYYLNMFPQWDLIEISEIEPLNATNVRELYFVEKVNLNFIRSVVPSTTYAFMEKFLNTVDYGMLRDERRYIENYKATFANLPYPPVFVTTDAVVISSGHVLMIRRGQYPGKGLWALPGGFLNAESDKSIVDCMVRELKEETKIDLPVPVIKGSIKESRVFDAINRSSRGRVITHAFKIELANGDLPKVKGSDDADMAKWTPIAELSPSDCYEDHYEIIQTLVGC